MNALAALLLVGMLQDSSLDEVAAKFPQSLTADRGWEIAEEYYRRIGQALVREDYESARHSDRRARTKLPDPFRRHLMESGDAFWPLLPNYARNSPELLGARQSFGLALGWWGSEKLPNPALPRTEAAWLFAFRGELESALACMNAYERSCGGPGRSQVLDEHRRDMAKLKASLNDPDEMAKLVPRLAWSGDTSIPAAFAVLQRLKASPQRASALKAGAAYLKAIKDEAGARAWEDQLETLKEIPVEDVASILLARSNEAVEKGDFKTADEGYRRILREWPKSRVMGRALYNLGFSLMKQKRFPEARAEFEKLLKADVNDKEPGDHIMELARNYRPKAIVRIGECYEGEGNWEMALKSYDDQRRYPMRSGCGNCSESMAIQAMTRLTRAMHRLGRHDEAMKKCREMILGPEGLGSSCTEICLMAVDIAVIQGNVDAFEQELKSQGEKRRAKLSLDYLRVLRLRTSRDYSGLFDVMRGAGGLRCDGGLWEDARRRQPVAVEAAECLGELGDAAFEWLCEKVRTKSDRDLALIAIAHFKTTKALDFIRSLPVRPQTNDAYEVNCLEKLHVSSCRTRSYPPRPIQKQDVGVGSTAVVLAFLALAIVTVRKLKRGRRPVSALRG